MSRFILNNNIYRTAFVMYLFVPNYDCKFEWNKNGIRMPFLQISISKLVVINKLQIRMAFECLSYKFERISLDKSKVTSLFSISKSVVDEESICHMPDWQLIDNRLMIMCLFVPDNFRYTCRFVPNNTKITSNYVPWIMPIHNIYSFLIG